MADEGIKYQNQIRGITDSGEVKNIRTDENGALKVAMEGAIETTTDKEKVLASGVETIGTTASTITINGNVTILMFANYSEEADVTLTIGQETIVVAASIALEIPVNKEVTSISVVSTAADTKIYYLAKGTAQE